MSKRNITRSGWRWLCGALAVLGAVLILASFFGGPELRAESPESERAAAQSGAAPITGHLPESELREGDVLMRDYIESLKRSAPNGMPSMARTHAIEAAGSMPALSGPGNWTFIGPDVITNGQGNATNIACSPVRINVSGRVTALAFGKDPSTIYLGSASGGLWRSTDGASSWKPLLDQQVSLAVGGLAVVQGTPDTVYVGTGEGNSSCDSEFGQGILKSTDGGDSWAQKAAATFDRLTFTRLSIDPADPKVLYAATNGGNIDSQSSTCFGASTGTAGVYKSTDAGETWSLRSGMGGLTAGAAFDVQPNPAPSFSGPFTGTIFDSGGDSCQGASTPPGQATLTAFNPANAGDPNPFKIQVAPSPTGGFDISGTIQVKQNPVAGSFPAGCNPPPGPNPICGICDDYGTQEGTFDFPYDCNGHVANLSGATTDFLNCRGGFAPGSAPEMTLKGSFTNGVFTGTIGIDNIVCDINCAEDFLGPQAITLKFVPEVFAGIGGGTGGFFKSTDGAMTWSKSPTIAGGARLVMDFSNDGSIVYVANTTIAQTGPSPVPSRFGAIYVSTDEGSTFVNQGASLPTVLNGANCITEKQGFYDFALAVDPTNSNHVYVGLIGLYSSTDSGKHFDYIGGGTHADQHALKGTKGGLIYAGNDGGLFVSANSGSTWTSLNSGLGTVQFQGIGLDSTGTQITGGTQDNGTDNTTVGTLSWAHADDGDGGYALIDQNNPAIFFDEHFDLSLGRSKSSGGLGTFSSISPPASSDPIQFYAPFAADPSNPDRVLYGTNRIWESCHLQAITHKFVCDATSSTFTPGWSAISTESDRRMYQYARPQ